VVFEIEDAGDNRDKAFLMGAVLLRLTEYLRLRQRAEGPATRQLRHLTVVEEAHRLLRQPPPGSGAGPAAQAVEMFADMLAEIRAYGEGLIIAEQIPSKLIPDVIKNTAVKITHRLPAADDRDTVGATMNLHSLPSPPTSSRSGPARLRSSPTAWTTHCWSRSPTAPPAKPAPPLRPRPPKR
jgi:DNA helicase HerA-like ATPase